jgi:hypothetical protein
MIATIQSLLDNIHVWSNWFWAALPWIMSVWFMLYGLIGRRIEQTPDKKDDEYWGLFNELMWVIGKIIRFDIIPPKKPVEPTPTDPTPGPTKVEKVWDVQVGDTTLVARAIRVAPDGERVGPARRLARLALRRAVGPDLKAKSIEGFTDEQADAVLDLAEAQTGFKIGQGALLKWLFDNRETLLELLALVLKVL